MGLFGEGDYARDQVLKGAGRDLLSKDTIHFLETNLTVGGLSAPAALSVGRDIVRAVGRRMVDVPVSGVGVGVGGPVKAVLVGPMRALVQNDGDMLLNAAPSVSGDAGRP
jgi:hypothetical protein